MFNFPTLKMFRYRGSSERNWDGQEEMGDTSRGDWGKTPLCLLTAHVCQICASAAYLEISPS